MNKYTLIVILLSLFYTSKAQDRIITTHRDTIHCRITSIGENDITYKVKRKDGTMSTKVMPLTQVQEYIGLPQLSSYSMSVFKKKKTWINVLDDRWVWGLYVGRSNMPNYFDHVKFSTPLPEGYTKLKSGFNFNASSHYMFLSGFGLGFEYSFFYTGLNMSTQNEVAPSVFLMTSEKDRQYFNYYGASMLLQQYLDAKQKFVLRESISTGVMFARMESETSMPILTNTSYSQLTNNALVTGNTFSLKLGLTAEYRLSQYLWLGLGGGYFGANLHKTNFEARSSTGESSSGKDQELTNTLKLNRFEFSLVCRIQY